jgi:Arc/MetJ-type ribon-helix-helix transcriptional regulator
MANIWSAPTSWTEVCQRANGRRKYHSLRRLQARLRRQQVARPLRREGLGYGVRARLARTRGVSKATLTSDVRAILAMPVGNFCRQRHQGVRRASETGRRGQPPSAKKDTMSQRYTVRLPETVDEFFQIEAEARQGGVSDLIREGLERLLGFETDHGAEPSKAPEPAPLSTPTPHDCPETILARRPGEVSTRVVETARLLNMPVLLLLRSLVIAASWPKGQAAPQVPQAALLDAAPASTTPIPRTSPPDTGARPDAPSPAALGVQVPWRSHHEADAV